MKIKNFLSVVAFLLASGAAPAYAVSIETPATHAILVDVSTGTMLLGKSADEHMPTSSMSKTMTLYMVFDALKQGQLKLTDELPVSEKAWRMQGSKMFIRVGSKVKVEDLIRGVAIQSGNDATVALAEGLAGTEDAFVERMNTRAKELGMANSHFMDASGWPAPEHYSTPRDLALLAQHLITDFPEYYHYFSEKKFTYNKIHQQNRDPLLGKVEGADGIKTGHTDIAGYGLIGSALRNGRRLILVINGLKDEKARQEEGAKLLEWGFRNFENKQILKAGDEVEKARVWLGKEDEVPLVVEKDLTVVLPVGNRSDIKMTVSYAGPAEAPIKKGTPLAKLNITIPDQPPVSVALLAKDDVERKWLLGRIADRFHYLVSGTY
ncbi:MAG: D-alanyl-D-alanine carboxypeptidase [Alphaproteobacteria bacterium]|nr:D-alanyl-D-alanine carboxypeptidase [Alphaproteobacteria bacterium]